jgi:hypothetical protein
MGPEQRGGDENAQRQSAVLSLPVYVAAVGRLHSTGEADDTTDMKRNCSAGLKAIVDEKISPW